MTIFKSAKVTELESKISELEGENAQLKTDLETANGKATSEESATKISGLETENAELKEANAEIEGLNSTITAQKAEIKDLTEKATFTAKKVDEAAALKLAANGHGAPLDLTGNDPTETQDSKIKGLVGLAKVEAAFKASKK